MEILEIFLKSAKLCRNPYVKTAKKVEKLEKFTGLFGILLYSLNAGEFKFPENHKVCTGS